MNTLYDYVGIDYGNGKTNIDTETGIRYGVIPFNEISQAWCDSAEAHYDVPTCPECGTIVEEYDEPSEIVGNHLYVRCENCEKLWNEEDCYPDEPEYFSYDSEGYEISQSPRHPDIWVFKSPFFTYAQFCSPCAPGACYLLDPVAPENEGNKCYCLGQDWFDDGEASYPVYSVETGELVEPTK